MINLIIYILHVFLKCKFQRKICFVAFKISTIFCISEIELWMNGKFYFKCIIKLHLKDAGSFWFMRFKDNDSFQMDSNSKKKFWKIMVIKKNSIRETFIHPLFSLKYVYSNCEVMIPKFLKSGRYMRNLNQQV